MAFRLHYIFLFRKYFLVNVFYSLQKLQKLKKIIEKLFMFAMIAFHLHTADKVKD